jgi:hypothetical protein
LIGLTFSNISSAGFLGIDGWFSDEEARCRIKYTQLDLATGLEKNIKITVQFEDYELNNFDDNVCVYGCF